MNPDENKEMLLFIMRSIECLALNILSGDYTVKDVEAIHDQASEYANALEHDN